MHLSEIDLDALEKLGAELEAAKWAPATPLAEPFDVSGPPKRRRRVQKAVAFLREWDSRIRPYVCVNSRVRPEIVAAGSTAAIVADSLQAAGGFPVPVWALANAISQFGLAKYCSLELMNP